MLDEIFGTENYIGQIAWRKTGSQSATLLPSNYDFLLHYARDKSKIKFRPLYIPKLPGEEGARQYIWVEAPDGKSYRHMTEEELTNPKAIPKGWRVFRPGPLTSPGFNANARNNITLQGREFHSGKNRHWSLGPDDTEELDRRGRVLIIGNTPCSKLYLDDYPVSPLPNVWADTGGSGFAEKQYYVVQTDPLVPQRCMLMTTDPGDLILDPTCGSGTTALVAEQWGRRWVTIDTSRVALSLARQRTLTARLPFFQLQNEELGVKGGFIYETAPHRTLSSVVRARKEINAAVADARARENKPNPRAGWTGYSLTSP